MRFNTATFNSRLLTRRIITVAAATVFSVGTALAGQPATYHDVAAMDAAIDRLDGAAERPGEGP